MGGRATGHFGTSITGTTHYRLLQRIVTTDLATQTEYQYLDKQPMRSIRDCSPEIKKACVKVSVKFGH